VSRAFAALMILGMVAAGCGPTSAGQGNRVAAAATGGATATASTSGGNGTLTIAISTDQGNWDPIDSFSLAWGQVANQIFDGLVYRGPDLKIEPGLATSWQWLDPKTLQVKLRQGVTFQDGEPFNAQAVAFTFNDFLLGAPGKASPQLSNYTTIDHVQVVDDYTVNFVMKEVDPVLVTKLAGYGAMIVPPLYIKQHGDTYFDTHPIGTGPFKVTEYVPNDHLTLVANPSYFKGAPKLREVVYRFVPDNNTRVEMLSSGEAQIVQGVPVSLASTVSGLTNAKLVPVASPTVVGLYYSPELAPTNNILIRQAIAAGIDIDTIIKTVLGGYGKRVATFQGSQSFGFDPNLQPYAYDPAKAKQLLQQAGFKSGTPFSIAYSQTDTTGTEVIQAVRSYLQNLGFDVSLKPLAPSVYFTTVSNGKYANMWTFGWGGWTFDFDNTADLLFKTGESYNPGWSDPQIDQLIDAERSSTDQQARLNAFLKLDQRLYDLDWILPLYQSVNLWGVSNRVQGFVVPPDDRVDLWNVSLSGS
jgi:peptide/nickel transport system substrate-binding protein